MTCLPPWAGHPDRSRSQQEHHLFRRNPGPGLVRHQRYLVHCAPYSATLMASASEVVPDALHLVPPDPYYRFQQVWGRHAALHTPRIDWRSNCRWSITVQEPYVLKPATFCILTRSVVAKLSSETRARLKSKFNAGGSGGEQPPPLSWARSRCTLRVRSANQKIAAQHGSGDEEQK